MEKMEAINILIAVQGVCQDDKSGCENCPFEELATESRCAREVHDRAFEAAMFLNEERKADHLIVK